MKTFPAALERLSEQFARLPGIGSKTAQRLAFQVLSMPQEQAQEFADAILDAKRTVHTCPVCQNLTDQELCGICADSTRDHTTICVVAEPRDVIAMYLSRLLRPIGVKVTRLAYGIPVGSQLEYADEVTLLRALEGRREM